jgi:hypothetical protein
MKIGRSFPPSILDTSYVKKGAQVVPLITHSNLINLATATFCLSTAGCTKIRGVFFTGVGFGGGVV